MDLIKAVPPDQMDVINKSGQARTAASPILRTAMLQLDQAARSGPNPFTDVRVRRAANLSADMDGIIKHVLNGLGDRVATAVNPMAFGWDASLKPYRQDIAAAKKLLAEAGYPNGVDVVFNEGPPTVEPGQLQTDEAIVADMTKAGFRVKRNYTGDNTVFVARAKEGKLGPMFDVVLGLLLGLRRRRDPLRRLQVRRGLQLLLQQGTRRPHHPGPLHPRPEEADRDLRQGPEDALRRCGLRLQVGPTRRMGHLEPRRLPGPADEVDRMFLVTPRKK